MRGTTEALAIGERIAWYRRRRGMQQEVLAGLVGRTADWLGKVENGRIGLDRLSVITDLAHALGVRLTDLLPTSALSEPPNIGADTQALREALTDIHHLAPRLELTPAGGRPDLGILRSQVGSTWSAYQDSRYARSTRLTPKVLAQAHLAARTHDGDDQLRAQALLGMAYQGAAMVLTKLGETDLAWIAADRGLAAAQASGDPVAIGSLFRSVVHCLLANGRLDAARNLTADAGDYLRPELPGATPDLLSVYGTLFLAGSVAAARAGDRAQARDFLAEADQAAVRLGGDGNHVWTAFGPTNVAIHRVAAAMELGDVQIALDQGPRIDTSAMPLERRVRHALEMARAYTAAGRADEAIALVLDAEELAPEQVRCHFLSRQLVTAWVRGVRGKPSTALADLATRTNVIGRGVTGR